MRDEAGRAQGIVAGVAVAAVVLAPLLTTGMPFRSSLRAQAYLMLGATLVLLAFAMARKPWRARAVPPRPLVLGLALYAGAAVEGAAVALVRGNNLTMVSGQLLAMGLLPLAALGAYLVTPVLGWRAFAAGVVGGVAVSTLVQLAVTGPADLARPLGQRLILLNGVSASGLAPMALLLGLALSGVCRSFTRVVAVGATGLTVLLILGSRIRSQWLVVPVGIVLYLAVARGRAWLTSRRVVTALVATVAIGLGVAAATAWWWNRPRTNLASGALDSGAAGAAGAVVATLPAAVDGSPRIRGTLTCQGIGIVSIVVQATTGPPRATVMRAPLLVARTSPADFVLVLPPQRGMTELTVKVDDPDRLDCTSRDLAVEEVTPAPAAVIVGHLVELLGRPVDPGVGSGFLAGDASLAYRAREMSTVLEAIRSGGWPTWVFGSGLGATFALDKTAYDNRGLVVRYGRVNYIHNFFLFLPFKLGAIGTAAVLTAMALFVHGAWRAARGLPPGAPDRRFSAAAAASWITYIAWSAAAPEILDFRLAPFWGVMVALTGLRPGTGATEPGAAATEAPGALDRSGPPPS